jgi:hypothetical protein
MHWYSLPVSKPISTAQKFAEPAEEMPPGISKSTPDLPTTIRRPLPAGR